MKLLKAADHVCVHNELLTRSAVGEVPAIHVEDGFDISNGMNHRRLTVEYTTDNTIPQRRKLT